MKNIVIITSNAIRHQYFKICLSKVEKINVLKSYVESDNYQADLNLIENKKFDDLLSEQLINNFNFSLTENQKKIIGEINNDFAGWSAQTQRMGHECSVFE